MVSFTRKTALLVLLLLAGDTGSVATLVRAANLPQPLQQQAKVRLPKGVEFVTSAEGINEYKLDNGMKVLLVPDQSKQTITVNITYLVGSRHEGYGETGMAHLLEHLVFKGTPKHPNIPQELTEHGARPNGTTWYDRTNYFETFQATEENLDWALDLEADRMVNSFIKKEDLDSEMTVVRNEFESGENDPSGILLERTLSTAFLWHNYGKSTIGAKSDLENVPIDRLQAFYKKYYQPDNAILVVAGKFDEEKTLEKIARLYGAIPRPDRKLIPTYTLDPTQDGERLVVLRRVGDTQNICVVYHVPAAAHPDYAAVELLSSVLGSEPNGRLHKELVQTKKASRAGGFSFPLREPGIIFFGAELLKDAPIDPVKETLLSVVEQVSKNPVTADEVEKARTEALKNIDLLLNNSERLALQLSEYAAMGDWRLLFLQRERLKKVSAEDVNRVAAKYLKASNRTMGIFIPTQNPDRAEIPETPQMAELFKDFKVSTTVAQGEAFNPSPENIEARTKRITLPNGMKLALLSKKTRGGSVTASITFRFGDEKSLMNRKNAGDMTGDMLTRGTKKRTREQIKEELDRLKARAFVRGGATQATGSIETTRENLPAVLRLLAEILREPSFPADQFEQLKQEQLAELESQRSEPQFIALNAFQRYMAPYPKGDVRYTETIDEAIDSLKTAKLEDVQKFYADFYGANNAEMAIVGDFDEAEITRLITELFGDWKSSKPYKRVPSLYHDIKAENKSFETPDKANAFFIAGMQIKIRDDNPDYPALLIGNSILGGGFLNSRLAVRIRQKEGISYGVGSQLRADPLDEQGNFIAFAIYAPQNVARLEAAFKEEVEKLLKDGITEEELKGAIAGYLQSRQVSRAQDGELARQLSSLLFLNRTFKWDAEMEKKISSLTLEQVNTALRKYLDPAKISIFKAGDFAKSAGK